MTVWVGGGRTGGEAVYAFSGNYGVFSTWRLEIARAAGYPIYQTTTDSGLTYETVDLDWSQFQNGEIDGRWAVEPTDPLLYLLVHSDCSGSLDYRRADRLGWKLWDLHHDRSRSLDLNRKVLHRSNGVTCLTQLYTFATACHHAYKVRRALQFS